MAKVFPPSSSSWKVVLQIGLDQDAATLLAGEIRMIDQNVKIETGEITHILSEESANRIAEIINAKSAQLEKDAQGGTQDL